MLGGSETALLGGLCKDSSSSSCSSAASSSGTAVGGRDFLTMNDNCGRRPRLGHCVSVMSSSTSSRSKFISWTNCETNYISNSRVNNSSV